MYQEVYTSRIKKDVKLVKKQGKDKDKLNEELEKLLDEEITLELKEDDYHGNVIYDIYIDNKYAGALEGNYKEDINSFYIENIKKNNNYKGHELLKKVVNYLFDEKGYDLGCLPLPKYRSYYEELGFTEFMRNGEDIFYHKTH